MPGTARPVYALRVFRVTQPAGEWASSPEERRAESSALYVQYERLGWKRREGCYYQLVGQPGAEEGGAGVLEIAIRFPQIL